MTRYNVKITPLTPVHIGTGEELFPYEYRMLQGKTPQGQPAIRCWYFDLQGLLRSLDSDAMRDFEASLGDMVKLRTFFRDRTKNLDRNLILFDLPATQTAVNYYSEKFNVRDNALELRPFIRPPLKGAYAYIPGSSLKGALKGAWIVSRLKKMGVQTGYEHEKRGRSEVPVDRGIDRDITFRALNVTGMGDLTKRDPFKAVKVGDTTDRLQTQISLVTSLRWKGGEMDDPGMLQILTEVTPLGIDRRNGEPESAQSRIIIDEIAQQRMDLSEDITAPDLIELANFLSEAVLAEDQRFFSHDTHKCGDALSVTQRVQTVLEECRKNGDSCIIRLGWGSGFNSTSLNTLGQKPLEIKTRKLADGKWPMGWVRLDWKEC